MSMMLMQSGMDLDDIVKLAIFLLVAIGSGLGSLLKKKANQQEVDVEVLHDDEEDWIEISPSRADREAGRAPQMKSGSRPIAPVGTRPASPAPPAELQPGSTVAPKPPRAAPAPVASPQTSQRTVRNPTPRAKTRSPQTSPPPPPSSPRRRPAPVPASGGLEDPLPSRRIGRLVGEHLHTRLATGEPDEPAEPADASAATRSVEREMKFHVGRTELRRAVVLSEILGPPLSLRHEPGGR